MKELTDFLDKYEIKYKIENELVIADDIYLYDKGITELPKSIGSLKCEILNLSQNNITELPKSIGNLKCKELYLHQNEITELPKSIGNLKCEYLYLSYNNIPKHNIKYLDRIKGLKSIYTDSSNNLEETFKLCQINTRKDKIKSII